MPTLVSVAELKTFLGDAPASADDALLAQLIDDVEALFASETGRSLDSFVDADSATETHDGTGSYDLWLNYPLAEDGLNSVLLGYDTDAADETLDVADKTIIVYGTGSRRITRVDGGRFGRCGQPRYVTVEYDHLGDSGDSARLGIQSVAASLYRGRGSEGMHSETVGSFYSYTRDDTLGVATSDPFWRAAVAANRRTVLV